VIVSHQIGRRGRSVKPPAGSRGRTNDKEKPPAALARDPGGQEVAEIGALADFSQTKSVVARCR
jgi:hypothetical protein